MRLHSLTPLRGKRRQLKENYILFDGHGRGQNQSCTGVQHSISESTVGCSRGKLKFRVRYSRTALVLATPVAAKFMSTTLGYQHFHHCCDLGDVLQVSVLSENNPTEGFDLIF